MGVTLRHFLVLGLLAFVVTYLCVPLARRLALRLDAVDYPSARRVNKRPTPRMGGIAMAAGIAAALIVEVAGEYFFGWAGFYIHGTDRAINHAGVMCGLLTIVCVGAMDDVYSLKPSVKFAGQILGATIIAASGLLLSSIANPLGAGFIQFGWWSYPLTVLYLVCFMNVINLIDGLDGLAAGISAIASMTMFVLSIWAGRLDSAALSIAVVGSSLGFLRYNFHPASIFMGDSGSLTLGFALGVSSLLSVTRFAGLTTIAVPLVISAVPILDTFSAIVRRTRAHVSVGHADRGHIHHRLMDEGYDQRQSVLLMYGWTALLCGGSILMTQVETIPRILIFCALLALSMLFAQRLHLFEPVLLHHYDPKTGEDELVSPADAAFEEEARAQEAHHHGRRGRGAR